MKALEKGLHVMIFSDHVPLEKEIELKKYARKHHLLVMGPDCGTAIINGVPLAFANVVKPGNIGVVAASGTGLQEVTTLISNAGGGISQAVGTGGNDILACPLFYLLLSFISFSFTP
jgi:succinyl-CoA synthetase alpha subunit